MTIVKLTDNISYLPASKIPFSSDVVFVKTKKSTWVFDVGVETAALEAINSMDKPLNVVISHFHPDHIMNLNKVKYENLYVSAYTRKYTKSGTIVETQMTFDEDPKIYVRELPSSHAKGCLCLVCGDYAFMGDGTFCKIKIGQHSYNVQLLKAMIDVMKTLDVKYFCLSHEKKFVQEKDDVIRLYERIYNRRKPNSTVVSVEDFFNEDGSVKEE